MANSSRNLDGPAGAPKLAKVVLIICLGIVGIGVGGWCAWDGFIKDRVIPKRFAVVHEGTLYRSGELSEALVERTWRDYGIDVVVNLGVDKPGRANHIAAQNAATNLGIERDLFSLNGDGTGKPAVFAAAVARIHEAEQAGDTTIVHCKAGQHRTGAVIATYRLLYDGWTGERALNELLSFGVQKPEKIVAYLNARLPAIAQILVDSGALDKVPMPLPTLVIP